MKLIKFKDGSGIDIYINPEHISFIGSYSGIVYIKLMDENDEIELDSSETLEKVIEKIL